MSALDLTDLLKQKIRMEIEVMACRLRIIQADFIQTMFRDMANALKLSDPEISHETFGF